MQPDWQSWLTQNGAVVERGAVQHFGDPAHEGRAAANGPCIADLSHQPVIRAYGVDTEKFLQGQLTNDVRQLDGSRSQLSAYCSPKGRALAIMRLFRRGEAYCLLLPASLLEPTLNRLRKYVLMSKVTLEAASDWIHIGYADPQGDGRLRMALGCALPTSVDGSAQCDDVTVLRVPGAGARFELIGTIDKLRPLWQRLAQEAPPIGAGAWNRLDIDAGIPGVYPESADAFVPQMLNLDLLGGISFKKGCYTGQEVVARMHYLGKLKRRMFRLHCRGETPPAPGTAIFNTALRNDESAGTVVRAEAAPDGGSDLLAVLHLDAVGSGELRLGALDGPRCERLPLPYEMEV